MDWRVVLTTFGMIFLAEMGDKTQLAAMTMAAQTKRPWAVFIGSSLALVCVSALGVAVGALLSQYLPLEWIKRVAAVAFIIIGVLDTAREVLTLLCAAACSARGRFVNLVLWWRLSKLFRARGKNSERKQRSSDKSRRETRETDVSHLDSPQLLPKLFDYFHNNREELARALGLHRSTVDRWFIGKSRPNNSTLLRMRRLAQERGIE